MWMIGLYLLVGLMTWIVYDKAAKEIEEEPSDAFGMLTLIGLWPVYLWNWFTNKDDGN